MARWILYLSEFDIKLVHILGEENIQADSLSRRPDLCPQGTDNEDVVVLPEHLFVNLIDMELQKKIANTKNIDYDAAKAIKELLEQGPREAKKDLMDWEVEEFEGENILFYKGKNYMPIYAELHREIVQRYHDCYDFKQCFVSSMYSCSVLSKIQLSTVVVQDQDVPKGPLVRV
jgi:hypothetical protein